MTDITVFEKFIGHAFRRKELLFQALTHRSYLNEHDDWRFEHNERLEFLGDAVIELVVTDRLFRRHPDKREGDLTFMRSALVDHTALAEVAKEIGIAYFLYLSRGQERERGAALERIMGSAVEALVGALYLDRGYDAAKQFVLRFFGPLFDSVAVKGVPADPKSALQTKAQDKMKVTPSYRVHDEEGPAHEKSFVVGAYLGTDLVAEGVGNSKAEAERHAAEEALVKLHW